MIFDAEQQFVLTYPGSEAQALAFLRDPGHSLRLVRFLRGLSFDGQVVRAEMLVSLPMLGELVLPFESEVLPQPGGAVLTPRVLSGKAWVEVGGRGAVHDHDLQYALSFRVHLTLPPAEKWGGAAFEKMVQAAARKTLERVAREFPEGVRAAMP